MLENPVLTEGSVVDVASKIAAYTGIIAAGSVPVWAATEGLGTIKILTRFKPAISTVFGVVYATFFWMLGWLPTLPTLFDHTTTLWINGFFAGITGLGATALAKGLNSRIKPLQ